MLAGGTYFHPIYTENTPPLLPAAHATLKGTGLVHIAPAHGPEDFLVALENKIPVVTKANCLHDMFFLKNNDCRFVWWTKMLVTPAKRGKFSQVILFWGLVMKLYYKR